MVLYPVKTACREDCPWLTQALGPLFSDHNCLLRKGRQHLTMNRLRLKLFTQSMQSTGVARITLQIKGGRTNKTQYSHTVRGGASSKPRHKYCTYITHVVWGSCKHSGTSLYRTLLGPSWLSCKQWNLSIEDTFGTQLAVLYTVTPLYRGHHWDPAGCPVYSGTSL